MPADVSLSCDLACRRCLIRGGRRGRDAEPQDSRTTCLVGLPNWLEASVSVDRRQVCFARWLGLQDVGSQLPWRMSVGWLSDE